VAGIRQGIRQHHAWWRTPSFSQRVADLLKRDLRLGPQGDLAWCSGLGAASEIARPGVGQVEPGGDR
jgi:hypothetical protein